MSDTTDEAPDTMEQMRRLLIEVIDPDRLRGIIRKLAMMAESGHVPSIRLIFTYLIGKPPSTPRAEAECPEQSSEGADLDAAADLAGVTRPIRAEVPPALHLPHLHTLFPEPHDLKELVSRTVVSGHDIRRRVPRKEPPRAEPPSKPPPKSARPSPAAHLSQAEAR